MRRTAVTGMLCESVRDSATLRLRLVQTDASQLRISEETEGLQAARGNAADAGEVVADHAEVVVGDVRKMRAAGAVAHSPYARRRGPESLVDLDEAPFIQFHTGGVQAYTFSIRDPAAGDKEVRTVDYLLRRVADSVESHGLTRPPLYSIDAHARPDLDSIVVEELP